MDAIRLLTLTGCVLSAMLGGLYASARAAGATETVDIPAMVPLAVAPQAPEASEEEALPTGLDVPAALLAQEQEDAEEVFVDAATGVQLGPITLRPLPIAATPIAATPIARAPRTQAASASTPRRAAPRPAAMPRLDADPGRHVILTARGMMSRGETVRGSCYAYLSEVFDRAGHEGWRTRTIVHQAGASGPYANLDLLRPGDWLYIVNNPDSTPMGTHSVLFVGWEDRGNGYARTISHAGWAAGASTGREGSHDVTRTYRIIRPRMAQ